MPSFPGASPIRPHKKSSGMQASELQFPEGGGDEHGLWRHVAWLGPLAVPLTSWVTSSISMLRSKGTEPSPSLPHTLLKAWVWPDDDFSCLPGVLRDLEMMGRRVNTERYTPSFSKHNGTANRSNTDGVLGFPFFFKEHKNASRGLTLGLRVEATLCILKMDREPSQMG